MSTTFDGRHGLLRPTQFYPYLLEIGIQKFLYLIFSSSGVFVNQDLINFNLDLFNKLTIKLIK